MMSPTPAHGPRGRPPAEAHPDAVVVRSLSDVGRTIDKTEGQDGKDGGIDPDVCTCYALLPLANNHSPTWSEKSLSS